ncbi:MAG: hypothetical protein HY376_02235 [Candidatus Blackburnbacteria bacterium]|nr:hypothetical protein [Candidatus Blackburnbacteria bacterium]
MKHPEKNLLRALKMMRENSYLVIDEKCGLRRQPSNYLFYRQAEEESIFAQEEIGRRNKAILEKEAKGNPCLEALLKRGEMKGGLTPEQG